MSDPLFDTGDGNTPIDEDEAHGLKLTWVRTRGDLNEAEAANILDARRAIRSPALDEVLDDLWLRQLHRRMFGDVWSWAGIYRLSDRNIGTDWTEVPAAVRRLIEDAHAWIRPDEQQTAVARFHHRLVAIHPFPNGNGRHSRAATDYLCNALGIASPTWGALTNADTAELRAAYLAALRTADRDPNDLEPLVDFMWS
ncbi:MAG: mobile mystery protein B [Acidimicrobiales bacterium]|nr:mobile mystery protein B [Acidimicrobiales bacterium]